ncbi:hypothetical protein A6R68_06602, partial [Neotoma lepida]
MDPGKDDRSLPQPSGPPTRKKFVIPMEEDEVPPPGAKPLFRSSRNPTTTATSAQEAPQSYAEYAIAQPPGGAGATGPTGSEPVKGENPSQTLKTGAKSSSILVSPRQRGNPVLKFVRNVPWEFSEVIPDYKDPQKALKELAKMCILADCTLVLAWSAEEAGRYLETYKAYEQKPADLLMEKLEQNFLSRSLEQLFTASREDLALCPGLGPQK